MNRLDAQERLGSSVEFIGDWKHQEAYASLKRNDSVHDPKAMQDAWSAFDGLEAQIGVKSVIDSGLLALLALYRRAVCKITCSGVNYQGATGEWVGTGFLVGPNLLVTNHHVLNSEAVAATARVDFEYERTPEELLNSTPNRSGARRELSLQPSRVFITSPVRNGLDYTFVWIGDEAARDYGFIPMSRGSFTGRVYDPIFIIHHPGGGLKQASLDDTELLNVDGDLLLYAADTERGSSGAPVLTRAGKLCGLHHAFSNDGALLSKHEKRASTLQDGETYRIANEGIKFSAISLDLQRRIGAAGVERNAIMEVLKCFNDSDTLVGPFGAWGRSLANGEKASALETDRRRIPELYQATEQDLDIAVWNLEWLNVHRDNAATIKQIATVFADITQDVWVLDGISSETAIRLRNAFTETFSQLFQLAFADDDLHPAQPLTVLLYNTRTVKVERHDWPEAVTKLWRVRAERDLHLETLDGPIFPSFPARFRVRVLGRKKNTELDLVPLFVGSGDDKATLRSAIAALLLPRIIDAMQSEKEEGDWLIVGDVNTPLRKLRLDSLGELGYTSILALDEQRGGFGYLRNRHNSILSQIFVPKGTQRTFDDQGLVTVIERTFEGRFAEAVSSTTPFGTRISLLDEASAEDVERTRSAMMQRDTFEAGDNKWVWEGLGKSEFMSRNRNCIDALLTVVNKALVTHYGADGTLLTFIDLQVLIYCEAGFRDGAMDANAAHSLGERGLLPLPSNLSYWLGGDAPSHDKLLSLSENVHFYGRYLAAVKNKSVKDSVHGKLYCDLFKRPLIQSDPTRQAKLLAGIIHGYFLNANYRGGKSADIAALMDAYEADVPIQTMLSGSGYVHDGTSILINRQRNVDLAVSDHAVIDGFVSSI